MTQNHKGRPESQLKPQVIVKRHAFHFFYFVCLAWSLRWGLTVYPWLSWNSFYITDRSRIPQKSSCLCFLSAGNKGKCYHHAWFTFLLREDSICWPPDCYITKDKLIPDLLSLLPKYQGYSHTLPCLPCHLFVITHFLCLPGKQDRPRV